MLKHRLLDLLPALVLASVLGFALWHDIRSRRIPNRLIVLGSTAGFLLHLLLPPGSGLFSAPVGSIGILFSLSGFMLGLLLLLPFYALRTLGAGDVKLMALVGAFIGPNAVVGATLLTMLFGGVLALVVAAWSGQLLQVFVNIQQMLHGLRLGGFGSAGAPLDKPAVVTGKLAYAIAIACGTVGQLLLADSPGWRFFS
jgi:prepilin peptidase CpaA